MEQVAQAMEQVAQAMGQVAQAMGQVAQAMGQVIVISIYKMMKTSLLFPGRKWWRYKKNKKKGMTSAERPDLGWMT